ncbi:hypothetical protein N9Q58_03140 [Polaribacter sp.]|nr:hypothetical protein [Polaribacter sp.]
MKLAVFVVLLLIFIANCQTIIQLFLNPSYARLLTKNQDVVEVVGFSGGYGLVYASLLTFIANALPLVKQNKTSKLFRILLLLATSSSVFLIWKAGFFLALVLLGVGILIMIIGVEKHQIMKSITISIFVLGTLFLFRNSISNTIISSTLDTKYEEKVSGIFQDNSIDSDEFDERQNRYSRDLNLMIEYPVIGCWQFLLVGKHSFILDILAQYGLIFGSFFLFAMFFIPIQTMKKSEGSAFNQSVVFVLVLFIFLLLNTLSISILPIIFIIFPYTNHLLQQK